MPKPIATWNPARDVWETPQTEGLFCEHLDVYSETFPTSGMTANGEAYALPTWEPRTAGSGSSSLLPTATARDWKSSGTAQAYQERAQSWAQPLSEIIHMLPTPTTSDTNGPGKHGTGGPDLRTAVSLLPTPVAQPSGNTPENHLRKKPGRQVVTDLAILVENNLLVTGGKLLPSPRASEGEKGGPNMRGSKGDLMLSSAVTRIGATAALAPASLFQDVPLPIPGGH